MKRVMPVHVVVRSIDDLDSEKRLQRAYNRIFDIALEQMLQKRSNYQGRRKRLKNSGRLSTVE
jgi:hypothetical protein